MNVLGIIPARYASTRLLGKPLIDIHGKPMIQWIYEAAKKVLDHVYVATDDSRIVDGVKNIQGKVVRTSPTCANGTQRCIESLPMIEAQTHQSFDVILNIQGDEPLLHPDMLKTLLACFKDPDTKIATLVSPILCDEDLFSGIEAKVVFDKNYHALYFSRAPIPHILGKDKKKWRTQCIFYKHIGLYAFQKATLLSLKQLPATVLEQAESLEQNAWLEHGYRIKVAITQHKSMSIDTKADLERIRSLKIN